MALNYKNWTWWLKVREHMYLVELQIVIIELPVNYWLTACKLPVN